MQKHLKTILGQVKGGKVIMCCQKHFYDKFIQSINQWKQDKIVAISILVYANENFTYKNIKKFFEISIGYVI